MPRASLIYLTYNSEKDVPFLPELIEAAGEDLTLYALENASTDGTWEALLGLGVKYCIPVGMNLGFTGGINLGLKQVRAEWAIIANPDVRVSDGPWLPPLLDVPDDVGIVGARLVNGQVVMGGGCVSEAPAMVRRNAWHDVPGGRILSEDCIGRSRMSQILGGPGDFTEKRYVPWVAFALVALRMKMVHEIGLLDEQYWHFYSDNEYCLRALICGWQVMFNPVTFIHPGGSTMMNAPDEIAQRARDDIKLWCRREPEYIAKLPVTPLAHS